eukprot:SAG31_NODE_30694_length_377_cov_0.928058_1_plen_33_part_00
MMTKVKDKDLHSLYQTEGIYLDSCRDLVSALP